MKKKKIQSRGEPGESYFGDIPKMKESCLDDKVNAGFKAQIRM